MSFSADGFLLSGQLRIAYVSALYLLPFWAHHFQGFSNCRIRVRLSFILRISRILISSQYN